MLMALVEKLRRAASLEDRRWKIDRIFVVAHDRIGFFPKYETAFGGWRFVDNPHGFGDFAFAHHTDAVEWIEKNFRPQEIAWCDPTETQRPARFVENFRKHGRRYRPAGEDFPA